LQAGLLYMDKYNVTEGPNSGKELAERKNDWQAPLPRYTRGVQAKFAFNASSASKGAVLDDY